MITISKAEKEQILAKYPDTCIVRTMKKDSKRHHYYMTESYAQMRYLKILRGEYVPEHTNKNKKGRGYNRYNKKA